MKKKKFDLYFETSALQGQNIQEVNYFFLFFVKFLLACTKILDKQTTFKKNLLKEENGNSNDL